MEQHIVYAIELGDDGTAEGRLSYVRLPAPANQPHTLRFRLTAGLEASVRVTLQTNYPVDGTPFERRKFHVKRFTPHPCYNTHCDLTIEKSGAYEYYVEYDVNSPLLAESSESLTQPRACSRTGYFIVAPKLVPRKKGASPISLDGIVMQSVIPKLLGPVSTWEPKIKAMGELGYNMIHYVPLQERGISNSPYSIYDQLSFSNDLFDKKLFGREDEKLNMMRKILLDIEEHHGILGLTDVVWNHTACNSKWLEEHPEAGYNLVNSPHLTAAYEVDEALRVFSMEINSKYGLKKTVETAEDLDRIIKVLKEDVLTSIHLWEFYVVDVKSSLRKLSDYIEKNGCTGSLHTSYNSSDLAKLTLKQKADLLKKDAMRTTKPGGRFSKEFDCEVALDFILAVVNPADTEIEVSVTEMVLKQYETILNEINLPLYKAYDEDAVTIVTNVKNRAQYTRLDSHGPKLGEVNESNPIVESYFTRLPKNETTAKHPAGALLLANNGWIWNSNPLQDFASAKSHAYLRREVIVWGDCVKLRYGRSKEENPWLWKHMEKYTKQMATLFHGFRIDNCHSTPLHVAQYLLDAARSVQPDLYVVAELFTGSEEMDVVFVSRLGINSLIREAMQAWDAKELSRLIHRYGGKPIGSLDSVRDLPITKHSVPKNTQANQSYCVIPLSGSIPHALFMDCTHDNETPNQKRTAEDTLPTAALIAMSSCAIGSVKGYDDVYPKLIELVGEKRPYQDVKPLESGIGSVRKILSELHAQMSRDDFHEIHVHHESQFIVVHRMQPKTHEGFLVIARTAFRGSGDARINPVILRSTRAELKLCTSLVVKGDRNPPPRADVLAGLDAELVPLEVPSIVHKNDHTGSYAEINPPKHFPPGSIIIVKTTVDADTRNIRQRLREGGEEALKGLGWEEMNVVLYRTDDEERDATGGHGAYSVPGYGSLIYCGLQGFQSALQPLMRSNDLGSPICQHLREGRWAASYCVDRLNRYLGLYPKLAPWRDWLTKKVDILNTLPPFLVPKYFAFMIMAAYRASCQHVIVSLMSPFVRDGDEFTHKLALTAIQMLGRVNSTSLHPTKLGPSLAAGLPHFSTHHMRCWGRDIFISLRGMLMVTGNHAAAREHLIAFGGCLKHGLIPNLLDSARSPRYNARDATWFFMQSVQDYCLHSPEGLSFLSAKVPRRFPSADEYCDATDKAAYSRTSTVVEILQEILQKHAEGISFREHNAGPNLDHAMREPGFNVNVFVDWATGFVHGGNEWNCGTWMDKMGDSDRAGTRGVPGTPRDGAAVEINGLLKSNLRWMAKLASEDKISFKHVTKKDGEKITYQRWSDLIQQNFERCFYVPVDESQDKDYDVIAKFAYRRGIYKDLYKSSSQYHDYQFRPNFLVAMVVAPELFTPDRGLETIQLTTEVLAGPMGMRTLDPKDWAYRPYYDNSNDSDDPTVAKGRNYHQGPEWLWVTGYFLRALMHFDAKYGKGKDDISHTIHRVQRHLIHHRQHIEATPWAGLPELTNKDGELCNDSCRTQAWSSATLLDLLDDMKGAYDAEEQSAAWDVTDAV